MNGSITCGIGIKCSFWRDNTLFSLSLKRRLCAENGPPNIPTAALAWVGLRHTASQSRCSSLSGTMLTTFAPVPYSS